MEYLKVSVSYDPRYFSPRKSQRSNNLCRTENPIEKRGRELLEDHFPSNYLQDQNLTERLKAAIS